MDDGQEPSVEAKEPKKKFKMPTFPRSRRLGSDLAGAYKAGRKPQGFSLWQWTKSIFAALGAFSVVPGLYTRFGLESSFVKPVAGLMDQFLTVDMYEAFITGFVLAGLIKFKQFLFNARDEFKNRRASRE